MKGNPKDFIPNQQSQAADWQDWYDSLRGYFPKQTANELWLKAWTTRQSSSATTAGLAEYMQKKAGIDIKLGIFSSLKKGADSFVDGIEGFFGTTKIVLFVVGGLILIPVVMTLINVARNPNATIGAVGKARGGM